MIRQPGVQPHHPVLVVENVAIRQLADQVVNGILASIVNSPASAAIVSLRIAAS